jgi:hypothetical protein
VHGKRPIFSSSAGKENGAGIIPQKRLTLLILMPKKTRQTFEKIKMLHLKTRKAL